MKLIRGGKTLQSLVRRYQADGMPVGTSLRFLKQILLPLAWMHTLETPMVHGDLKPDNILLTDSLDLIVTDFGLAARLPLGSMGGAIQYQAPETLLGVCAEAPADVYGLGLIWYEMLTGHHPFQDVGLEALAEDDSRAFIHAHQLARKWPIRPLGPQDDPLRPQRVRPASETNEELREHPQLEAILNRCLAYKQSDRYANAKVLLADLEQYSQTGKVPGLCSDIPKPPSDLELPGQTSDNLVADALSLIQQGRHLEAIAKAESALKLSAQSIPALLALVRARTGSRQLDKAKEIWQQSQQLAPHDPDVYQAGAELYQAMGKPGMAQSLREQAITARQRTGRR
jgi:serine/threonine protein kinase